MLAAIRLRGGVNLRKEVRDTAGLLGLKRKHTLAILPEEKKGMIKRVETIVAWGEISEQFAEELGKTAKQKGTFRLKPPRKGFKSVKLRYPKGDLGYRGGKIEELIKRMM